MRIIIENVPEWYTLEHCGQTMTAGELMDVLSEYDPSTPIYISNDNGYTYSSLTEIVVEGD